MNASQRSAGSSNPAAPACPPKRTNRSPQAVEGGPEVQAPVAPARRADHVADVGADDRRPTALVDEPGRDEPDDPDRPRSVEQGGRGVRIGADDHAGRGAEVLDSGSGRAPRRGPGADATRASAMAVFIRSRRVTFAASRRVGELGRLGLVLGQQQAGGLEGLPHPPGGVEPWRDARSATVSRSTAAGATPARSRSAAIPGRGAVRIRSRPSRAIARFSPRTGATSATVPIVARSASGSARPRRPRARRRAGAARP